MAKRFGRNQKRKMNQEIEALKLALYRETKGHQHTRYALTTAKNEALQEYVKHADLLKSAFAEMSYGLGRSLGAALQPHTEELLKLVVKEPLEFEYAGEQFEDAAEIYEIRIPLKPLHIKRLVALNGRGWPISTKSNNQQGKL